MKISLYQIKKQCKRQLYKNKSQFSGFDNSNPEHWLFRLMTVLVLMCAILDEAYLEQPPGVTQI